MAMKKAAKKTKRARKLSRAKKMKEVKALSFQWGVGRGISS